MNSLAYHHQELEERIKKFDGECELAINNIRNLKKQARTLSSRLAGEPRELKNRFLQCTKQLDEFMYHITDFNLNTSALENAQTEHTSQRNSAPTENFNGQRETLLPHSDMRQLAETNSRTKQTTKTLKKENCKEPSAPHYIGKKEIICQSDEVTVTSTTDCNPLGLPPQPTLDPSMVSKAIIISINGSQLWMVVEFKAFTNLVQDMTDFYEHYERGENLDYIPENVCAYYDEETKLWYRALYVDSEPGDPEVFLVDTGEFQPAVQYLLRPLDPKFCAVPPLAHLCCLADVDQTEDNNLEGKQTEFLQQFWGECFKIRILENDTEEYDPSTPVFVYLYLEDGRTINELLVQALASSSASPIQLDETKNIKSNHATQNIHNKDDDYETDIVMPDKNPRVSGDIVHVTRDENARLSDEIDHVIRDKNARISDDINHVDDGDLDLELDYSKHPEYENALEAVTGYNNRDEMDICKHYKGGDGCFKGQRCKKRHVKMHPGGYTLDRVSVAGKYRPAPLPAPGTWHKVKVTHVDRTCLFYVHFEEPEDSMSIADLVDEMTLEAANSIPSKLEPALGELVSARFSDGRYYRAQVILTNGNTEVMYIDFGNTAAFSLSDLRPLESRWLAMPVRAVRCRLAGVSGAGDDAAAMLMDLALDKIMQAKIITRNFDEVTVQLLGSEGFDVAEQLATLPGVQLRPYSVEDDSQQRYCHVPA